MPDEKPQNSPIWVLTGLVSYEPDWMTPPDSDSFFERLLEKVEWQQHEIRIFGRIVQCPRLSAWHGDIGADYSYSGIGLTPEPWLPDLLKIKCRVETAVGCAFNSVLLNLYRDGRDSMGWHADDEPELGIEPVIASLSLGATRRFRLKRKLDPEQARRSDRSHGPAGPVSIDLASGSLLVMHGRCQSDWLHALPKTRRDVGARINLTFRQIVPKQ